MENTGARSGESLDPLTKVYVELTTACNLDCVMCVRRTWKNEAFGPMDWDVYRSLIEQLAEFPQPPTVHFGGYGEPMTYPYFLEAIELAKEAGAKRAIKLAVSVPSHCELMRPAADGLAMHLEATALRPPRIPVVHNVDVSSYDDVAAIRQALLSQLYQPVRWVETVQSFRDCGIDQLIEFGPGKVLTGLTRRIDKSLACQGVFDEASLEKALTICDGEQS